MKIAVVVKHSKHLGSSQFVPFNVTVFSLIILYLWLSVETSVWLIVVPLRTTVPIITVNKTQINTSMHVGRKAVFHTHSVNQSRGRSPILFLYGSPCLLTSRRPASPQLHAQPRIQDTYVSQH